MERRAGSTDVGAVRSIVSSDNGWLIRPGSVSALEGAFIDALELSQEELLKKKQSGLALVKRKYLWDTVAKETAEGIQNAIENSA